MKTIYKYTFDADDEVAILMPSGSEILCVQVQGDRPCIWAIVDTAAAIGCRRFRVYGTGHRIDQEGDYIGTFQLMGGSLVFHLFEVPDA